MNNITAKIQMLGGFRVQINGLSIDDSSNQSKKPWSILEYLITFRDREITTSELIDLIWPEGNSRNPSGALKTLVFRSRKLLEPLGVPSHTLIIQKQGTYAWNPTIETIVDTDEFEQLCNSSREPGLTEDKQLELMLRALELYQGDFLPKSSWESWAAPICAYYHSLYLKIVHQTIKLLFVQERWDEIISICQKAIKIEPFDEELHYHLIYSYYSKEEQSQALNHYQLTTDLFYNEFAITPSERLKDLYKLIRDKKHGITTDLSIIQESMQEDARSTGAYCCEFSVFRDIYQLERRAIERTGDSIFLCLLTIRTDSGDLPKLSVLSRAMGHLEHAIISSLRRGDAYTRYSVSQYMIMLPTASYENGEVVLKRIVRNFKKAYIRKELILDYSLQAIAPASDTASHTNPTSSKKLL